MYIRSLNNSNSVYIIDNNKFQNSDKIEIFSSSPEQSNSNDAIEHSNDNKLSPEQLAEKKAANEAQLEQIAKMKAQANRSNAILEFNQLAKKINGTIEIKQTEDYQTHILHDKNGKEIQRMVLQFYPENSDNVICVFIDTPEYDENDKIVSRTVVNKNNDVAFMKMEFNSSGKLIKKTDLTGELPTEEYFYNENDQLTRLEYNQENYKLIEYYDPSFSKEEPYKTTTYTKTEDGAEIYTETIYNENLAPTYKYKKEISTVQGFGNGPFILSKTNISFEEITIEENNQLTTTSRYIDPENGDKYEIIENADGKKYFKNEIEIPYDEPIKIDSNTENEIESVEHNEPSDNDNDEELPKPVQKFSNDKLSEEIFTDAEGKIIKQIKYSYMEGKTLANYYDQNNELYQKADIYDCQTYDEAEKLEQDIEKQFVQSDEWDITGFQIQELDNGQFKLYIYYEK